MFPSSLCYSLVKYYEKFGFQSNIESINSAIKNIILEQSRKLDQSLNLKLADEITSYGKQSFESPKKTTLTFDKLSLKNISFKTETITADKLLDVLYVNDHMPICFGVDASLPAVIPNFETLDTTYKTFLFAAITNDIPLMISCVFHTLVSFDKKKVILLTDNESHKRHIALNLNNQTTRVCASNNYIFFLINERDIFVFDYFKGHWKTPVNFNNFQASAIQSHGTTLYAFKNDKCIALDYVITESEVVCEDLAELKYILSDREFEINNPMFAEFDKSGFLYILASNQKLFVCKLEENRIIVRVTHTIMKFGSSKVSSMYIMDDGIHFIVKFDVSYEDMVFNIDTLEFETSEYSDYQMVSNDNYIKFMISYNSEVFNETVHSTIFHESSQILFNLEPFFTKNSEFKSISNFDLYNMCYDYVQTIIDESDISDIDKLFFSPFVPNIESIARVLSHYYRNDHCAMKIHYLDVITLIASYLTCYMKSSDDYNSRDIRFFIEFIGMNDFAFTEQQLISIRSFFLQYRGKIQLSDDLLQKINLSRESIVIVSGEIFGKLQNFDREGLKEELKEFMNRLVLEVSYNNFRFNRYLQLLRDINSHKFSKSSANITNNVILQNIECFQESKFNKLLEFYNSKLHISIANENIEYIGSVYDKISNFDVSYTYVDDIEHYIGKFCAKYTKNVDRVIELGFQMVKKFVRTRTEIDNIIICLIHLVGKANELSRFNDPISVFPTCLNSVINTYKSILLRFKQIKQEYIGRPQKEFQAHLRIINEHIGMLLTSKKPQSDANISNFIFHKQSFAKIIEAEESFVFFLKLLSKRYSSITHQILMNNKMLDAIRVFLSIGKQKSVISKCLGEIIILLLANKNDFNFMAALELASHIGVTKELHETMIYLIKNESRYIDLLLIFLSCRESYVDKFDISIKNDFLRQAIYLRSLSEQSRKEIISHINFVSVFKHISTQPNKIHFLLSEIVPSLNASSLKKLVSDITSLILEYLTKNKVSMDIPTNVHYWLTQTIRFIFSYNKDVVIEYINEESNIGNIDIISALASLVIDFDSLPVENSFAVDSDGRVVFVHKFDYKKMYVFSIPFKNEEMQVNTSCYKCKPFYEVDIEFLNAIFNERLLLILFRLFRDGTTSILSLIRLMAFRVLILNLPDKASKIFKYRDFSPELLVPDSFYEHFYHAPSMCNIIKILSQYDTKVKDAGFAKLTPLDEKQMDEYSVDGNLITNLSANETYLFISRPYNYKTSVNIRYSFSGLGTLDSRSAIGFQKLSPNLSFDDTILFQVGQTIGDLTYEYIKGTGSVDQSIPVNFYTETKESYSIVVKLPPGVSCEIDVSEQMLSRDSASPGYIFDIRCIPNAANNQPINFMYYSGFYSEITSLYLKNEVKKYSFYIKELLLDLYLQYHTFVSSGLRDLMLKNEKYTMLYIVRNLVLIDGTTDATAVMHKRCPVNFNVNVIDKYPMSDTPEILLRIKAMQIFFECCRDEPDFATSILEMWTNFSSITLDIARFYVGRLNSYVQRGKFYDIPWENSKGSICLTPIKSYKNQKFTREYRFVKSGKGTNFSSELIYIPVNNDNNRYIDTFIMSLVSFKYICFFIKMFRFDMNVVWKAKSTIKLAIFNSGASRYPVFFDHFAEINSFFDRTIPIELGEIDDEFKETLRNFDEFYQDPSVRHILDEIRKEYERTLVRRDLPFLAPFSNAPVPDYFRLPESLLVPITYKNSNDILNNCLDLLNDAISKYNYPYDLVVTDWAESFKKFPPADINICRNNKSIVIKFMSLVPKKVFLLEGNDEKYNVVINGRKQSTKDPLYINDREVVVDFGEDISSSTFVVANAEWKNEYIVRNCVQDFKRDIKVMIDFNKKIDIAIMRKLVDANNDPKYLCFGQFGLSPHLVNLRAKIILRLQELINRDPRIIELEEFGPYKMYIPSEIAEKSFKRKLRCGLRENRIQVTMNRLQALQLRSEFTIHKRSFIRVMGEAVRKNNKPFNFDSQPFLVIYEGQPGMDANGLCKDFITQVAYDMMSSEVGFFTESPNKEIDGAPNQKVYVPSPRPELTDSYDGYFGCGVMLCIFIRSNNKQNLIFPEWFYRCLCGDDVTIEDVYSVNINLKKTISYLNELFETKSEQEFNAQCSVEATFQNSRGIITRIFNGTVTKANCLQYIQQLKNKAVEEYSIPMKAIRKGFWFNAQLSPASTNINSVSMEYMICGSSIIDAEYLLEVTEFRGYAGTDHIKDWYCKCVRDMTNMQRQKLLLFVTSIEKIVVRKDVQPYNAMIVNITLNRKGFPIAHTCFNKLDLPSYSSEKELRKHLITAISFDSDFYIR